MNLRKELGQFNKNKIRKAYLNKLLNFKFVASCIVLKIVSMRKNVQMKSIHRMK